MTTTYDWAAYGYGLKSKKVPAPIDGYEPVRVGDLVEKDDQAWGFFLESYKTADDRWTGQQIKTDWSPFIRKQKIPPRLVLSVSKAGRKIHGFLVAGSHSFAVKVTALGDITASMTELWTECFGGHIRDLSGKATTELLDKIDAALGKLDRGEVSVTTGRPFGPAYDALKKIRAACVEHPRSLFVVERNVP